MNRWADIQAMGGQRAALFIYGDIVDERWTDNDVTAQTVLDDLQALGDVNEFDVHINSAGGNVWQGIAIYTALKSHPARVNVFIDGIAASIASVIASAGDTVSISDAGMVMIHNPWAITVGDANELRKQADMQDKVRDAMIAAYQSRIAMTDDELRAAMDAETWYTAQETVDIGFADAIFPGQAMAASLDLSQFKNYPRPPQPAAKSDDMENPMTEVTAAPAAEPKAPVAVNLADLEAKAKEKALKDDKTRRDLIAELFDAFPQHSELCAALQDDQAVDVAAASRQLLAKLGEGAGPVSQPTRVDTGEDEHDKFHAAAVQAIMAKAGKEKVDGANPLRGASMIDIMAASLDVKGVRIANRYDANAVYRQVMASGITHTTSDFDNLLEDAMHKMLVNGFRIAADTWRMWCRTGTVNDFRVHNRYHMGGISNITGYNEAGEFDYGTIGDAEKHTQQASTKGKIIGVTRELLINDDMSGLADLVTKLGRAAARAVETDAFTLLESNPTMSDGTVLFHSNHGNLGTAGAITPANMDEARQLMEQQQDPNSVDYLDLIPYGMLVPTNAKSTALQVLASEGDPTSGNSNSRKFNYARDMVSRDNLVSSPRLTGNAWYVFADPADEPVIEVAFLNGEQEPMISTEEAFNSAGVKYRVMFDYGVAAIGWRGMVKNAGA